MRHGDIFTAYAQGKRLQARREDYHQVAIEITDGDLVYTDRQHALYYFLCMGEKQQTAYIRTYETASLMILSPTDRTRMIAWLYADDLEWLDDNTTVSRP